jgi:hypothetical protein
MEKLKLAACLIPVFGISSQAGWLTSEPEPVVAETPAGCDQCKKSHQTIGSTAFVVTVTWGANSKNGKCVGTSGSCTEVSPCEFGAYEVLVTGTGAVQWREPGSLEWEAEIAVDGDVSRKYGDAADPEDYWCGDGFHQVAFPDDSAAGGPVCTECEASGS